MTEFLLLATKKKERRSSCRRNVLCKIDISDHIQVHTKRKKKEKKSLECVNDHNGMWGCGVGEDRKNNGQLGGGGGHIIYISHRFVMFSFALYFDFLYCK